MEVIRLSWPQERVLEAYIVWMDFWGSPADPSDVAMMLGYNVARVAEHTSTLYDLGLLYGAAFNGVPRRPSRWGRTHWAFHSRGGRLVTVPLLNARGTTRRRRVTMVPVYRM